MLPTPLPSGMRTDTTGPIGPAPPSSVRSR